MENIADLFYEKLSKSEKPGNILAGFYESIFSLPYSIQHIIMFNKLIKVYGKYIPFFAILDIHSAEKVEVSDNMYGLLSFFCKKRLEQRTEMIVVNDAYKNLDSIAEKVIERIEKQQQNPIKVEKME